MTQEFVTYEQALALKELGFDEPCFTYYYHDSGRIRTGLSIHINNGWTYKGTKRLETTLAPTFSQAFRWFREKHDLQYWLHDGGYLGKVFIKITGYKHDKFYFSSSEPMEYEEAESACLEKLIELAQQRR